MRAVGISLSVLAIAASALVGRAQPVVVNYNQTVAVRGIPQVRGVFNPATGKYQAAEFDPSRGWVIVADDLSEYLRQRAAQQSAQELGAQMQAAPMDQAAPRWDAPPSEVVQVVPMPWNGPANIVIVRTRRAPSVRTETPVARPASLNPGDVSRIMAPSVAQPQFTGGSNVAPSPRAPVCPPRGHR